MKDLRLLITKACPRNCAGCCNKDWDLDNLPVANDYRGYRTIMLTGGEPMLCPDLLITTIEQIRLVTRCPIIIYTADLLHNPLDMLARVDGLTVTLHEQADVEPWAKFNEMMPNEYRLTKSLRLNIFQGVVFDHLHDGWTIKDNIQWIKNCPLPTDEVFMRIRDIQ
jgi:hypothetical protein